MSSSERSNITTIGTRTMSSATATSRPAGQRNVTVRDTVKKGSKPRGGDTNAAAAATNNNSNNAAGANANVDRVNEKKATSHGHHAKVPSNSKFHPQQRAAVASLLNDRIDSDDIESKVNEVYELTKASRDSIIVALHDSDGDLNRAVSKILEGDYDDEWTDVSKRGKKKDKKEKQVTPIASTNVSKANDKGTNGTDRRSNQGNRTRPPRPSKQTGDQQQHPQQQQQQHVKQSRQNHKKDSDVANHHADEEKPVDGAGNDRATGKKGIREVKKNHRPGGNESITNPVRGRGTRTFSNQLRETVVPKPADEFPESIDVWQNTTVDANSNRQPVPPVVPMTVGNWSDVVRDDDWSEEDGFDGVKQTMVFVRSGKTPPEKDDAKSTSQHLASKQQSSSSQQQQCDVKQSELSTQRTTAGTQILQSLKSRSTGHDQNYSNKLAAESIKSLVGIPSAAYSTGSTGNSGVNVTTSATGGAAESASSKPQRLNTARRSTKIPETAVEMPNSLVPLGIQFGALDVNFGTSEQSSGGGGGYPNDIKVSANSTSNASNQQVMSNKVVSSNSVLVSSAYAADAQKGTGLNSGELRTTEDMLKGSAYGAKVSDETRSSMNKVKAVMDAVKGNDLYSSSITNQVNNETSGFSKAAVAAAAASYAAYGGGQNYSSGHPPPPQQQQTSVTQYQSYSGQQNAAVFNVNSNYPTSYPTAGGAGGGNSSAGGAQKNLTALKELDASVSVGQLKHNSNYGDLHGTQVNSTTQTTNVLKNSLSATGNGGKNLTQQPGVPRMLTQMLHAAPQYIVGAGGMAPAFAYPVFDPNSMPMPPPSQDATSFAAAYNSSGNEHKFSRTEGNDVNVNTPSSATSQAPVVSQQQQYIGALPPGYGYYFTTIPPQAGIFPPQGAPFLHSVQTNNAAAAAAAHASASAPGFAKGASYPGHSYSSSAYDASMTGVPTDAYSKQPYGQTANQHQSKTLVSGNADLMATQSSYGKGHGQVSKVRLQWSWSM